MRTDSSPLRSHSLNIKTFGVLNNTQYTPDVRRSHPFSPLQNPPQPR
ncbi:hypothetical protein [Nostoc sp.]